MYIICQTHMLVKENSNPFIANGLNSYLELAILSCWYLVAKQNLRLPLVLLPF